MAEKTYFIGNMDCAHCAQEVQDGVARLDGVNAVRVDFSTGKMFLNGEVNFDILQNRVEALGKTISTEEIQPDETATATRGGILGFWDYLVSRQETQLALIGGLITLLTVLTGAAFDLSEDAAAVFLTVAMLIALYPIARSGLNALRINHEFNINMLMTVAAIGAIILGEYLEAFTVIFLFAIGEALEGHTTEKARGSLRSLMSLRPKEAIRLHGDLQETVPVEALAINDVILVQPGEQIPMDGEIIAGTSGINQASITGESMPVEKTPGDTVFAGTVNGASALNIRVTHLAADNTLNRIIQMVEEAQSVRAPSQRMIDRFARVYTPGIMVIALLVAVIPPLLFNGPFYDDGSTRGWLYRALTILVIGCPCALVISTPVTVISAITAAARRGVLIKGGAYLETLGHIKALAFDKTGTLTAGKPQLYQVRAATCTDGDPFCAACDDTLALAAALERNINHPIAQAVFTAAEDRTLAQRYATATEVKMLPGQGVQGYVDDQLVTVASHKYFDANFPHSKELCSWVDTAENQGETTMLVHDGEAVRGMLSVADQIREDSRSTITALNGMGINTVMLTGDNNTVAKSISQALNLSDFHAGLMPDEKVARLTTLREKYGSVGMVGDGVNDTPALAAADIGIAMGGAGTAQALETAHIALMADDLKQLPYAVRLSRFAVGLIRQNIGLTFAMKAFFLVLAMGGMASMWVAVFADTGMSLIVTLNGMRARNLE